MPELPDVTVYIECLEPKVVGTELRGVELKTPFLLRTVEPSLDDATGRAIERLSRIGKQIVFHTAGGPALALHLMIAGRLHWRERDDKLPGGKNLAAIFEFESGRLALTEAGSKKRAALRIVTPADVAALDRGGIDPLEASLTDFAAALRRENRTLKRALTDPRLFSGIGNAYSDEILHAAEISPIVWTSRLSEDDVERLYAATQSTLRTWLERLRDEAGGAWPGKVTAFRKDMAVHGRYRQPCPVCGTEVQRIRYAANECNYCPRCQTDGKVLADRSLSRLLKGDWPRTIEELELRFGKG